MPKFSVVISVYNKAAYIAETLQGVLNQTYPAFEIVILNDGSTDSSDAAIQPFLEEDRIRYYSEPNRGAAAGRNFVIDKTQGDFIALLDADDLWKPYYLEEQARLIEKYPEESVFATNSEILRKGKLSQRRFSVDFSEETDVKVNYFEASFLDSVLHSSTTVVRKEVFNNVGNYDTRIKSGQDTDLYVRIGLAYQVVFSPKVCVQYRVLDDSLFRSSKKLADKPNFDAYELYEADQPALKKFLDLSRYSLCLIAKIEGNKVGFEYNYQKIDLDNLNKKQRFLLRQSAKNLKQLLKLKNSIAQLGIRLSSFK